MRCSPQHFAQGAPHFRNPFSLVCFASLPLSFRRICRQSQGVVTGHALPPPALCLLRMSHFTQKPRQETSFGVVKLQQRSACKSFLHCAARCLELPSLGPPLSPHHWRAQRRRCVRPAPRPLAPSRLPPQSSLCLVVRWPRSTVPSPT